MREYSNPTNRLHFYWIVQHGDIDAFKWFIHLITDLEYEHLRQRKVYFDQSERKARIEKLLLTERDEAKKEELKDERRMILIDEGKRYIEINLYVTRKPKEEVAVQKEVLTRTMKMDKKKQDIEPRFDFNDLYKAMKNPKVKSKEQVKLQNEATTSNIAHENRVGLSNTWVWDGRPDWNAIFADLEGKPGQSPEVGCCFCGAPVIGKALKENCDKVSS